MAPPAKELHDNFSERFLLENSIGRIGRLEDQVTELLPSVSSVVESCTRIDQSLVEIKSGMSSITNGFYAFQQSMADMNGRIVSLESTRDDSKEKALMAERNKEDRRTKMIGVISGAVASFLVALGVWFFGLR